MNSPEPSSESAARAPEPPSVLPSAATRRRWGRWWHWALATLALPLLLALVLGAVAWVWTGTGTSLASAVRLAAERLPSDQNLVAEGVTGSVRAGGHIDLLRWQRAGLTVEARDITIGWEWPLLPKMVQERSLRLQTLTVGSLRVDDQRPPSGTPFEPPTELVLPIAVDVPLNVGTVTFTGSPAVVATGLAGSYRFDGVRHDVSVTALQLADGRYRGAASLLARAPMTLDLQVQGDVNAAVPGGRGPLPLAASATVRGPLSGANAQLAVDAQLRPVAAGGGAAQPMQATVTAVVAPWAAQPVVQARAVLSRVNVAALWPDAPQTLLSGDVLVAPVAGTAPPSAAAWSFEGRLTNGLAGPWDQRRLPVQRLVTSGVVEAGRVVVRSLDADAAGGRLQAEGTWTGIGTAGNHAQATSGWQGTVSARSVNPAAVLAALVPAVLDGQLKARADQGAIVFDVQLKPAAQQPPRSPLQGLRLKAADARGQWRGGANGTVVVEALTVQTDDATLQGPLEFNIATRAARGNLTLVAPGTRAELQGALSAPSGSGTFALRVREVGPAVRWLATLPGGAGLAAPLANATGNGELTGRWQGGWKNRGTELQLEAQARLPALVWRNGPGGAGPALRDVQVDVSGRLSALTLRTSGQAETGTRRSRWTAQATGGQATPTTATSAINWQGQVQALTLQSSDSIRPGTWTVQLRQPVAFDWMAGAPPAGGGTFALAAGDAALVGPVPGSASIAWQPVRYAHGARTELRSVGKLLNVPLGWLEVLGDTQLAQLGLRGSLVFDGDWDVQLADTLRANVTLARRSGDLSVQTDDRPAVTGNAVTTAGGGPALVSAGVRDVRLTLRADGEAVRTTFKWDSERAGKVDADVTTRVARQDGSWVWPADAPLAGTLNAQLPRVGVWSVLAPPGWRIRGTLDASATLAGTRQAPQWRGTLDANDLAVRSVVEGIEFSDGRMRTTINGQRLDITEFTLRGASAGGTGPAAPGSGGRLTATGFAEWLTDGTPGGSGRAITKVRIALDAQAQALRVSSRADRRLVVSGDIKARLEQAKLEVRGNLKADQALFVLPDENAPTLGNDVIVRGRGQTVTATTSAPTNTGGVQVQPDLLVALDLGDDFRVQGRGLAARLAGKLNLRSNASTGYAPRLEGEVRVVRGTYKAYGQQLNIEEGLLRFSGRYDNPTLDILAIRPNMSQRVGVQINGTALAPRIRLYSDPELPDAEKLGWLVLGRAAANGGAESAVLQQAALALLGGNNGGLSGGIAQALGLDELSFRGQASRADGTTSAAAVTLGKRLSSDFYVAYERSLAGTLGTLYVFYDLSRRFTLRAQAGEQSAIDLIFTVPYD